MNDGSHRRLVPVPFRRCWLGILLSVGWVPLAMAAEFADPDELRVAHASRSRLYGNAEFSFGSKFESPRSVFDLQNQFGIFHVDGGADHERWIAWNPSARERESQLDATDPVMHQMWAFDGVETRTFERKYLGEGFSGSKENQGAVFPGFVHEPRENLFALFLKMGVDFVSITDPAEMPTDWSYTLRGEEMIAGQPVLVYDATRMAGDRKIEFEVAISSLPESLVLKHTTTMDGTLVRDYRVTRCGRINGTRYPAAGEYFEWLGRANERIKYEFEVDSAQELNPGAIGDWFPKWPMGTAVVDAVRNTTEVIPYSIEALSEIGRLKRQAATMTTSSLGIRVAVILVSVLLFVTVGFFYWVRRGACLR